MLRALLYKLLLLWPHIDVCKTVDGKKVVYMRRWFIWRNKWLKKITAPFGLIPNRGNIYLHQIFRSDDDPDPHDHPWDFTSIILSNGYWDEQWKWRGIASFSHDRLGRVFTGLENVQAPCVVRRKAEHIHRVLLRSVRTFGHEFTDVPSWSIVFTGPYRRTWTFLTERGHIPHWEYLGRPKPINPLDDDL